MNGNELQIFRIVVPVSEPETAAQFYSRLLDLEGKNVGGGRFYFDCGGVILALLKNDTTPNSEYIYFAVGDLEDIFLRAKELGCLSQNDVHGSSAGEIMIRPWGERSFYAFDPFGNGLCFVDKDTLFTGR
ncbi:MAG: VOC family protein [Pyrinomonadaceae bacterium]